MGIPYLNTICIFHLNLSSIQEQSLANGFEKVKWQHLLEFQSVQRYFFLAKQEEIGEKHMDSG